MFGFLLGSAYGVSAGLLVYGRETELFSEDSSKKLIIVWAISGLVLAFAAVLVRAKD